MYLLYIRCVAYILCMHERKKRLVMTTKLALSLHTALCNSGQSILPTLTSLKMSCVQRRRFNRGKTWMRKGVAGR